MARHKMTIQPKAKPLQGRRVYGFKTEQTEIQAIRYRGKRALVRPILVSRPETSYKSALKNYVEHKIFHYLFPDNSPKPLGVTRVHTSIGDAYGMVTKIVRNLDPDYKKFLKEFYSPTSDKNELSPEAERHFMFATEGFRFAVNKISQSGIQVDKHTVNIGNAGGQPVFFEVDFIATSIVRRYLDEIKASPELRQKIEPLLRYLETYYPK